MQISVDKLCFLPTHLSCFILQHNVTQTEANKTIDPFFEFAKNLTSEGLNVSLALTVPFPSIYEWFTPRYPATALGGIIQSCIAFDQP